MFTRNGFVTVAVMTLVVVAPAGGEEQGRAVPSAIPNVTIKTFALPSEFKTPWQVQWIAGGSKDGTIAFTDRAGNAVGFVNPTTGQTQRNVLRVITSPNGIAPIDSNRFAVAGTGGVAIFDRTPPGRVTELAMADTRNFVIAVGPNSNLYVPDFQNNDLRIIRAPYSGPADITKWALPPSCRGATGVVPRTNAITILCQQTNNIVDLSPTGALLRSTPLPFPNMGAQEARPAPRGAVFSGFNAGRVTGWGADYPDPYNFINVLLSRPAVSTVGYFDDPAWESKLAAASKAFAHAKKPRRDAFFNTFTPGFGDGRFAFGSFPAGTARRLADLANRNLVGSANGPGASILVADATPGRPAIHSLFIRRQVVPKKPLVRAFPRVRLTAVDKDFLARMTMPFFGPIPPREVRASVTGASSSPWAVKTAFSGNFNLRIRARAALQGGGTYPVKVQSGDTGAYTRAYRFSGFRPNTRSLNLTLTGGAALPASFTVDAVAEAGPCTCKELFTRVVGAAGLEVSRTGLRMDVDVTSILTCTNGSPSSGCKAKLEFSPTVGDRADGLRVEGDATASCAAPCGTDESQQHRVRLVGGANFGSQRLGKSVRVISLEIEQECAGKTRSKIVDFVFRENGTIDYRRSDLNGNGIRDFDEGG